jgi:DUF4097 and DUF4098 domain-containing protein YvlB
VFWNGKLRQRRLFKPHGGAWCRGGWGGWALVLFQLCLTSLAHAQAQKTQAPTAPSDRISVPLSDGSRPAVVKASLVSGSIAVKSYDGKEVVVEAQAPGYEAFDAKSNMKRVPITATGLSVEEENNRVHISVGSHQRSTNLSIMVPVRASLILRSVNGDISVTGVDGELDVNTVNGSVTLRNVSGTAVAHALNSRVLAIFNRVNREKPMAFSSLNGDIDVTFPADLKANISISSDRGEVYSDFDVQLQPRAQQPIVEDARGKGGKYRVQLDKNVRGSINGGGQEIQFKNFQGKIYIRKAGKTQ